ncbi:MAG: M20/M25/M40 family metallo-hydrolase [Ignavibacteria bacterium]
MSINSTSGQEDSLADYLILNLEPAGAKLEIIKTENGFKNLFYKWGEPEIIFCTHYDCVPPFIPPQSEGSVIYGRGACDAKGQIAVMLGVCESLYRDGENNFGLLLVAGEETGSYGAKAANTYIKGCRYVIIGEPTGNKLVKAAKGNILFEIEVIGKSCHSGYPQYGDDAVLKAIDFISRLRGSAFEFDNELGETTFNISHLRSDNACNVVSERVTFRVFFRTTFKTHFEIEKALKALATDEVRINRVYGDEPMEYFTIEGFETEVVSFGSDAPELGNLGSVLMYGPGSILTAHTDNEQITIDELYRGFTDLKEIYFKLRENLNEEN